MPFRPRLPLRRLILPYLRRRPPRPHAPPRRPLSSSPSSAAVAATESEEDAVAARDTLLAPPRVGGVGGAPRLGWNGGAAFGEDKAEFGRKASIAARIKICLELLRERRWREMRAGLAQMVSEQGSESAPTLCDILWNGFRECDSSGVVWDALANSYATAQMIHDDLYVLSKMNSLNMQISVSTYDSLLYGLRMTDMALELFEQMESCGDVAASWTLRRWYVKPHMTGLFYEVENLPGDIYNIGLDMDVVAYSILIHGHCKLGEIERALRVCNVMCCSQRVTPTSLNHLFILLGLCKKGLLVEARLYLENVASKYRPNDVVYNILIDGYAKIGGIGSAVHLYDQIIVAGMCPTIVTCNSLLYGYCKIGNLQVVESYFRAIQLSSLLPTAVTYATLMDALSEAGKVNTMLSLFDEMVGRGSSQMP